MFSHTPARRLVAFTVLLAAGLVFLAQQGTAQNADNEAVFTSPTIDLGVVVSDVDKAVAFYTGAIGFQEVPGFSVPADFCKQAGLTDGHKLDIRVLALGDGPGATRLKLMQLPGVDSTKSDNTHIHSQLGYSYITIRVADTSAAVARLHEHGAQPVAQGPVALPKELSTTEFLTVVRDPDGNLVELVGPKR
ncbi:MAG: VOC family protein [Pirellulales bacterium]